MLKLPLLGPLLLILAVSFSLISGILIGVSQSNRDVGGPDRFMPFLLGFMFLFLAFGIVLLGPVAIDMILICRPD
jgi:hypothetical protein